MQNAIDSVSGLLDSLLDVTKLEAGLVRPNNVAVNVRELFVRLDDEFQAVAKQHSIQLRFRCAELAVLSDQALLTTILRNFLSNAIRYSSNGKILVTARKQSNKVVLAVQDTGPGIPEHQQKSVFLEFV